MVDGLREAVVEAPGWYVAWGGLIIGIVFGFIVNRTNFCTMGSISDMLSFGDYRRFRSWLLAAAVALAGAQVLQSLEVVDLSASMYTRPTLTWGGHILGGLMFGFGMVLAGGCVSRNLVRIGSGNVGSLIVIIFVGLFAYITIGGLFGPLRLTVFSVSEFDFGKMGADTQSLGAAAAAASGSSVESASAIISAVLIAALLIYCFKDAGFRTSPIHIFAGIGIGICVAAGWALTGLAFDDLAETPVPTISLSFVRPAGDSMEYVSRFTALGLPGFGVVTLVGTILGSFLSAIMLKQFHLSAFNGVSDTLRNLGGAALMGVGGVLAFGCTVGQALTGVSTLSIGAMMTFLCIVLGGIAGVKYMEWRIMQEV